MSIFSYLLDLVLLLIIFVTAITVKRRMMVESALIFLAIVISSLVAITLYEPLADWCTKNLFLDTDMFLAHYLWFVLACFIFTFVFTVLLQGFLRVIGRVPQFGTRAESIGCWVFGGLSGYVLSAFLLTIFQTLPFPRDVWSIIQPEAHRRPGPVSALAPDYQFLTFVDYTCVRREALTGIPWMLGGPLVSPGLKKGEWASFPIRYALWREQLTTDPPEFEGDELQPTDDEAQAPQDAREPAPVEPAPVESAPVESAPVESAQVEPGVASATVKTDG